MLTQVGRPTKNVWTHLAGTSDCIRDMELCLGFSCDNGRLTVCPREAQVIKGRIYSTHRLKPYDFRVLGKENNAYQRRVFFLHIIFQPFADVYSRWIHTSLRSSAVPF